ncbi:hypothetical protein ACIQYG_22005 [Peribacillus sp. NPDC096622]|uniref:hypothetical protein n=1 Tax=Peribacillus sp. NPDC096622 TaxID=3364396 RepID=UPI0038174CCF
MNVLDFRRLVDKSYVITRLKGTDIEKGSNVAMDDLYGILKDKNDQLLSELEEQYGFAGKTSLNIFEGVGFPESSKKNENFKKLLKDFINSTTPGIIKDDLPLNKELHPPLGVQPVINLIKEREDGYLIQFVHGIPKQVVDGWTVRTIMKPQLETVIVRLTSPVFVEVRSGFRQCNQYLSLIQTIVGCKPGEIEWIPLTKLTEKEAERIAELLDAGLVEAEHLGTGIYGKKTVSAAEGINLRNEDEYREDFHGLSYLSQTMNVKYTDTSGYIANISFKVQMNGGFQFLSKVNESIITTVIDAFVQVRYLDKIHTEQIAASN